MDEQVKERIDRLQDAGPLETVHLLEEIELFDEKSSQAIIDEVYEQFSTGDHLTEEVLKPVFMSVADGLMEATSGGRAVRRKGLTASRILSECETFSYDEENANSSVPNSYAEAKSMRERQASQVKSTQDFDRSNYEDKTAMNHYKEEYSHGKEHRIQDEYTGKTNLYTRQDDAPQNYNDPTHRYQAQTDHVEPLKQVHDRLKSNIALSDNDIREIANIPENFAVTSAEINQVKREMTNEEYIQYMKETGNAVDDATRERMLAKEKDAQKAMDKKTNEIVKDKLISGDKDLTKALVSDAVEQAEDYAVGNVILFLIKPIYYELHDSFKNGLEAGVGASSGFSALKFRFGRVKRYVMTHARAFLGDNVWAFIRGFLTSLLEGIIGIFVGVFRNLLRLAKEGIKIFVQAAKILFGKKACRMTPSQKGDAIVKMIGTSVIAISGIGIDAILGKIGLGKPWAAVLSTLFSGIASALFLYLMDKIDLFSTKAEERKERIHEIFSERISDIHEAGEALDAVMIEKLKDQRLEFEAVRSDIDDGFKKNDIDSISKGLYRLADFFGVDIPYSNTDEFVDYFEDTPLAL